ncbi:MAG: hypothetical protein ACI9TV_001515 [Sulfurimonas sp.]
MVSFSTLHSQNAQNYYRYGDINTTLNKRAIVNIAKAEVRRLILQKKISTSWKILSLSNIEKNNDTSSWIVHFSNSKIKNKKYQSLYINIDDHGNVKNVSYSRVPHVKK